METGFIIGNWRQWNSYLQSVCVHFRQQRCKYSALLSRHHVPTVYNGNLRKVSSFNIWLVFGFEMPDTNQSYIDEEIIEKIFFFKTSVWVPKRRNVSIVLHDKSRTPPFQFRFVENKSFFIGWTSYAVKQLKNYAGYDFSWVAGDYLRDC